MQTLIQQSKPARFAFVLAGFLAALLVAMAARPAAGLTAPLEPPQLVIEPGSHDFGLQPLNGGSAQANFQIRNGGGEGVAVESLDVAGPDSGAFWFGYNDCWGGRWLEPGDWCSAQVYFGPWDTRDFSAQLRATSLSQQFTADLTGTGGRATFAPSSNPVDFGVAKVGSAGTIREIEIANTGNMPGGVFIAVIAGGAIGSFQILDENCTGVELAPAATCTVQVRFLPVSEGVKKAMLGLFGENDGPTPIVLTGVGSAPDPPPIAAAGGVASQGPTAAAPRPRAKRAKRRPKAQRRYKRHRLSVQRARLVLRARPGE